MAKKKDEKEKKIKTSGKGEKLADMSVEEPVEEVVEEVVKEEAVTLEPEKPKTIKTRGKKYQKAKAKVGQSTIFSLPEAIKLLKEIGQESKFDQTVEVHLNLLVKGLSGEVTLPHFQGKQRKVVIFDEKLAEEIKLGKVNFDVLIATPADMPKVLPLAKVLGPKGLMPNPKTGTVSADPKKAIEKFNSGALYFKTEKDFPLIHQSIGKLKQPQEELIANLETLLKAINPKNISKAVIKSTMSPAIKISVS